MKSIRSELTYKLLLGSYLLLIVALSWLFFHLRNSFTRQFDENQRLSAMAVADEFEFLGTHFEFDPGPELGQRFQPGENPEYFQFWLQDGLSLLRSASLRDRDLPGADLAQEDGDAFDLLLPDDGMGRAIALRFVPETDDEDFTGEVEADREAAVILVYAASRERLDATLRSLLLALSSLGLLLPAGTTLLVRSVVRRSLAPMDRLAAEIQDIEPNQLDRRLTLSNLPVEITPLVARLNQLMQRVQSTMARERRFTDNVSHELRTPLAELRLLTEVGLSEMTFRESKLRLASSNGNSNGSDGELPVPRILTDARNVGLRMERMVVALLALSRSEAGTQPLAPEWVDLPTLIREVYQSYFEKARLRLLEGRFLFPRTASIYVDRTILTAILSNLLSNAVSHAPEGSWFECSVEVNEDRAVVRFRNPSNEITSDDLDRLWEPFWRRTRSQENEHCGLGLSLVRSYAEILQADVAAELSDDMLFTIEFRSRSFRVLSNPGEGVEQGAAGNELTAPPAESHPS